MPLEIHWFLPTSGDGRQVAPPQRPPSIDYLAQVARAAEHAGFHGVLTPTGAWCEDAWLTVAGLARETERLRFIVAFRPGFVLPAVAAAMAATLQRITRGRLLLNVVAGGDAEEQRAYGDFLSHDERYRRAADFLEVVLRAWQGRPFDHDGPYYRVRGGGLAAPIDPVPTIYLGGASPAAEEVAARYADVYLLWGEPPAMVAERLARMRALAQRAGRHLRFGIRLHVIARDTEQEAWAEADRLLAAMDPDLVAAAQAKLARMESVGQARMRALHGGRSSDLVVAPNLWAGIGLLRGGAGTALVGSFDQVAARIHEYAALGMDTFILSGYPNLEEAYRVGEELLPRLGVERPHQPVPATAPFV